MRKGWERCNEETYLLDCLKKSQDSAVLLLKTEAVTNLSVECVVDTVPELKEGDADSLQAQWYDLSLSVGHASKVADDEK